MPSAAEEDLSFMQGVESILKGTFGQGQGSSINTKKGSKQENAKSKKAGKDDSSDFDRFLGTPGGKSRFEDFNSAFPNDTDDVAAKISKDFGMCFEKKKKTLEKEAVKMKMLTARHIQTEREILASDMEEMKKIQSEIKSVLKENEGLNSALKAAAAEYQKQHKLIERELMEAENEYKRNLQAIFNEASEIERSEEEDFKKLVAECELVAQNQKKRKLEVENKIAEKKRIVTQIIQKVQDMNR